jgi:hypothetical protein
VLAAISPPPNREPTHPLVAPRLAARLLTAIGELERDELWMLRASIHFAEDLVQNRNHLLDLALRDGQ